MSVKKMYLLDTGAIVASKNSVTGGSLEDMSEVLNMPCEVFLLETDEGYVLYDTGTHPEANKGHWNPVLSKLFPFKQTPEQRLEAQLALCGVKPEDIKTVVLSHFHCDHTGGLYLFPHADLYVPAEDFKLAMANIHSTGVIRGAYTREDIELTFNSIHLVEDDCELMPGIELIDLPGHTPGLLGMVVHLAGGTYIMTQDCLYTAVNYGPPAVESGVCYNKEQFFASIEKVRALAGKYHATVIFGHDEDFWKSLKHAPEFYA